MSPLSNTPISKMNSNELLLCLEQELDKTIDEKLALVKKCENWEKAYHIMCDETWELIPDEEKAGIHKKLQKLKGLNI